VRPAASPTKKHCVMSGATPPVLGL
jgi:hypothetical protein